MNELLVPPDYCQFSQGPCDQHFDSSVQYKGVFLYSDKPSHISDPIEAAVEQVKRKNPEHSWQSWKDFQPGNVIFCSVCKAIRASEYIIADITTLNFNLMFEIGYSIGLEKPILFIKDSTYNKDRNVFNDIGIIDTIKYENFSNSDQLTYIVERTVHENKFFTIATPDKKLNRAEPLYVIKPSIDFEQNHKLLKIIEDSPLSNYRQFDEYDTTALNLYQLQKNIITSAGVIAALPSVNREGFSKHNARVALIAGMALAYKKRVLLIKEYDEDYSLPIDYRGIVANCQKASQIDQIVGPFIGNVTKSALGSEVKPEKPSTAIIHKVDFGESAAENEIYYLGQYFYKTAQYFKAKQGSSRLIIGRKGTGKTAIFYSLRNSYKNSQKDCLVDLKPEGYQFSKLKDVVRELGEGVKLHALTAFWYHSFLSEICSNLYESDELLARNNPHFRDDYQEIADEYDHLPFPESETFAERLNALIYELSNAIGKVDSKDITQHIFKFKKTKLFAAISKYLKSHKETTWLLIDNLDKNWPINGTDDEDINILFTLIDALRKLKNDLRSDGIEFNCLVFLRNDIYRHLKEITMDKDKDDSILLDWSDLELFKKLLQLRLNKRSKLSGSFDELWPKIFSTNVGEQSSFHYVVDRTLMRPRDLLQFLSRIVEVTINRGHEIATKDDILEAEKKYSSYMLESLIYELSNEIPNVKNILYNFYTCSSELFLEDIYRLLKDEQSKEKVVNALLWYGFLGVIDTNSEHVLYSFKENYNTDKLWHYVHNLGSYFVIHPAFRMELGCSL